MAQKLPMLLMVTVAMAVQADTLYYAPDGSSSATNKFDDYFRGTGTLSVLGDGKGLAFIFR